tara:strand:+ start:149 stop:1312 length:1164 start_codon:yes stop_codon:yes gene_type:complete
MIGRYNKVKAVLEAVLEALASRDLDISYKKLAGPYSILLEDVNSSIHGLHDHNRLLLKQASRLDLYCQNAGVGLWDMEISGGDPSSPDNKIFWSQSFRKMLGYEDQADFPDELGSFIDCLHPDDKGRVFEALSAHLNDKTGRTRYNLDYRLITKQGEERWFIARGDTLRDQNGQPTWMSGSLIDVNEEILARKKKADEILQFQQRLISEVEESINLITQSLDTTCCEVDNATSKSKAAVKSVQNTSDVMREMDCVTNSVSQKNNKISDITGQIRSIAEQTNLLALNAAIESARAGEFGRGFSVVADEVRELASRSEASASEVTSIVEMTVKESCSSVKLIENANASMQEVQKQVDCVDEVLHKAIESLRLQQERICAISDLVKSIQR